MIASLFGSARADLTATFNSASDIGATSATYTASGTATLSLSFAPPTGNELTLIKNTGLGFISGRFANLAQGQEVVLTHGGINYPFVANYYGGSGNDLVLIWKHSRLVAWGNNFSGQLGDNSTTDSSVPVAVTSTGVFSGKTVVALSAGSSLTIWR